MDKVLEAVKKQIILAMQLYDFGHTSENGDYTTTPEKIALLDERAEEAAQAAIEAYHAVLKEDGYAIVPVEPTFEMCRAGMFSWESPPFPARYKAMIGAVKFGEGE